MKDTVSLISFLSLPFLFISALGYSLLFMNKSPASISPPRNKRETARGQAGGLIKPGRAWEGTRQALRPVRHPCSHLSFTPSTCQSNKRTLTSAYPPVIIKQQRQQQRDGRPRVFIKQCYRSGTWWRVSCLPHVVILSCRRCINERHPSNFPTRAGKGKHRTSWTRTLKRINGSVLIIKFSGGLSWDLHVLFCDAGDRLTRSLNLERGKN